MVQEKSNFLKTTWQQFFRELRRERKLIFVRKPRLVTPNVHTQMRVRASRFACQPIEFCATCVFVSTPTVAWLNLIYPRAKQLLFPAFFVSTFPSDRGMYSTPQLHISVRIILRVHVRVGASISACFGYSNNIHRDSLPTTNTIQWS